MSIAVGYRFNPTEAELVGHYLRGKTDCPAYFSVVFKGVNLITDSNVYAHEPWLLPWEESPLFQPHERYYFVKRERISTNGKGKRPKRTLVGGSDGGWWRSGTGDKEILSREGKILGFKKTLTFYRYINNKRDRKEAIKTDWIMHEYRLDMDSFQEWVLCRIHYNGKQTEFHDFLKRRETKPLLIVEEDMQIRDNDAVFVGEECITSDNGSNVSANMETDVPVSSLPPVDFADEDIEFDWEACINMVVDDQELFTEKSHMEAQEEEEFHRDDEEELEGILNNAVSFGISNLLISGGV